MCVTLKSYVCELSLEHACVCVCVCVGRASQCVTRSPCLFELS